MFLLVHFEIVHTESFAYITMWKESWIMSDQRGSDGESVASAVMGGEENSIAWQIKK